MIDNVSAVCASCNYHLRRLSSIRRYLTQDATRCAVQAFITSRLDYCNSLLHGIPLAQIERLQRIQNKAARLITRTRQCDHITPVLRALHWLPVCHRIEFKVLVNVFKCLHGLSPDYLTQLVHVHRRDNRLRHLHTERTSGNQSDRKACLWHFGAPTLESTTDDCARVKRHSYF